MRGHEDVARGASHPSAQPGPVGAQRLSDIRAGGKRALADALSWLEKDGGSLEVAALLDAALGAPSGLCLGLTGPPGVGKSTLTDALIRSWRAKGKTVAVIAVDPSSNRSGGALLGDRTRLTTDPADQGVFIRSMAARDRLGGVAEITFPAMVLMRALYDLVLVETVGVGQSEIAIGALADATAFCAQPGSGDALQFMKAGIMEVPDLFIVTKGDLGVLADRAIADLKGALSLGGLERARVLRCSARDGVGIDAVVDEIEAMKARLAGDLEVTRLERANHWCEDQIRARFGQFCVELVHKMPVENQRVSPFERLVRLDARLRDAITDAFL